MIGAGRDRKEDIDRSGCRRDSRGQESARRSMPARVLCRIYYTREDRLEDAAQLVEDAFRISANPPDERN